jgi:hypothetical protein
MEDEVVLQEEVIPADRPPMNTREVFLNPPDWRYQQAATYLDDERAGKTPTIPADPIVQLVIRALRAYRRVPNRLYMDALWNTTEEVIRLGTTMRQSAIVAEMEAHLIAGHSPESLKEWACHIPTKLYEMYGKIFFDLSGITAVNAWIHDFLIEPERTNKNQMLLRARLLAYHNSAAAGALSAVMGADNSEGIALLKQIGSNERQKDLFDYMVKHTKMPQETYVMLMETALKSMTERDFQEHMRDRDEAGSGSLEEIAVGIEKGVRHYTNKEIADVDEQGYDPTNQYTRFLTHKETADGE